MRDDKKLEYNSHHRVRVGFGIDKRIQARIDLGRIYEYLGSSASIVAVICACARTGVNLYIRPSRAVRRTMPKDLRIPYLFVIVEDMRKREYLGQLELMVLLAAIRVHENAYGVSIAQAIKENSGRDVALASVYAALERLEGKGFITSMRGEPTAERGGKARTYFKPSPAGLTEACEAHATLMRLGSGLPGLKGQIA